jgi:hypothetical protein
VYERSYLYERAKALTGRKKELFAWFLSHQGEAFARTDLALRFHNRRRLMRYDIECLEELAKVGLLLKRRRRISEWLNEPRPKNFNGQNVRFLTWYYTYELPDSVMGELNQAARAEKMRRTQPVKPQYTYKPSLIERLLDKVGF